MHLTRFRSNAIDEKVQNFKENKQLPKHCLKQMYPVCHNLVKLKTLDLDD